MIGEEVARHYPQLSDFLDTTDVGNMFKLECLVIGRYLWLKIRILYQENMIRDEVARYCPRLSCSPDADVPGKMLVCNIS